MAASRMHCDSKLSWKCPICDYGCCASSLEAIRSKNAFIWRISITNFPTLRSSFSASRNSIITELHPWHIIILAHTFCPTSFMYLCHLPFPSHGSFREFSLPYFPMPFAFISTCIRSVTFCTVIHMQSGFRSAPFRPVTTLVFCISSRVSSVFFIL